jgi:CDP-diacylglycerol---glycerol-3-phosphate 3-phosphatidyltransferase
MPLISPQLRSRFIATVQPIPRAFVRAGISPNMVTTVGFFVTISAAAAFLMGHPRIAGALVLLGGLFDILDGQVARASGQATLFGSFYDSTLDRISEVAVFVGIFSLYGGGHPDFEYPWMVYTVALAMAGSLMVSYTRARAEALGIDCDIGWMQRPERVVLIGVASLLFGGAWNGAVLTWVLIVMAVLTNFTAFQRIVWVYRHTEHNRPPQAQPAPRPVYKIPSKRRIKS